jgi:nicotinamidase-related amidase
MPTSPLASLVDPRRTAVLVVDVQPLFTADIDPPADQVLPALRRFLAAARVANVLRVFTRFMRADVPDERWTALWQEQHGAGLMDAAAPDSPAVEFSPGFEPEDGDLVVTKDRYSAFQGTCLADQLRSRGIETVIITGFTTAVCVSSTARDAFQLDFHTITLSDCCAESPLNFPISPIRAHHEAALVTLGSAFGRICASDEVVAAWRGAAVATTVKAEPVATISPVTLMQLATGFWAFKTLAVAHELDLFTRMSDSAGITSGELAHTLGIQERPAEMLLTGCAALDLLERHDGRYHNAPLAEEFLVRGKPYYFGGCVQMFDQRLYPGWGKLLEAVRTNRPTTWNPDTQDSLFDGEDPAMLALFWEAMHSLSTFTARTLGEVLDFSSFSRLLDLGGGSGAFDIELCRRHPQLRATIYDLPVAIETASMKVRQAGLADRVQTMCGDFFTDVALPPDHDVILLSMILHDWSEAKGHDLLRKCYDALPAGGAVLICELLVNDEKTGPVPAALMSLNMLIETEGRNYTSAEYGTWLREAGFQDIYTVWYEAAGANGVVVGRKP